MKTPAYVMITLLLPLVDVVALAIPRTAPYPPPIEQPWKSGATTVTISPDGVLRVSGEGAMEDYDAYTGNRPPWHSAMYYGVVPLITMGIIEEGVTHIGDNTFFSISEVADVTIPKSVFSIGERAFAGTGLTSVTIPNGVVSIGKSAFSGCTGLTSVTIPSSVTVIGEAAFSGCTGLTSVTIPSSLVTISGRTFWECTNLALVTIEDGVTAIGEGAFGGCTSLTSVTIPNSVISIGASAFHGSGLTSVTIPNSVTHIGALAFSWCIGLKSVTFQKNSMISVIEYGVFDNCTSLTSIKFEDKMALSSLWFAMGIIAALVLSETIFVVIKRRLIKPFRQGSI